MKFAATCLFGLERLVGEEIDALGYKRTNTIDGRVFFEGDESAVARFNIFSRYAERLFIILGEFRATTFSELFDGVKNLPLEDYIEKNDAFPVKGHSIKSSLYSIPDCQKIIKKASVERLKEKYGISWFPESGVKKQLEFFILNDMCDIMLDTTGAGLYKRGYRTESNTAPIRETLAAALVKLSRPRRDLLLWDPFCGSGTIPIEAALQLSNTAPGILRRFVSERYTFLEKNIWTDARNEARSLVSNEPFEIYGSDIDPSCVALSIDNAKRAKMNKYIKFFKMDMRDINSQGRRGTIVTNPPYGERLMDIQSAEMLYQDMGKAFSTAIPSWQIYVITNHENFERFYGRRADKARKLYNGMIKCNYYQFFKKRDSSHSKKNVFSK